MTNLRSLAITLASTGVKKLMNFHPFSLYFLTLLLNEVMLTRTIPVLEAVCQPTIPQGGGGGEHNNTQNDDNSAPVHADAPQPQPQGEAGNADERGMRDTRRPTTTGGGGERQCGGGGGQEL